MPEIKIVEVQCRCGTELARYRKEGKGHLIKMFLRGILIDRAGVFLKQPPLPTGTNIICPKCEKRVATIQMIHGEPAAKMNQGAIKPINT
jgi:hypothetical protein